MWASQYNDMIASGFRVVRIERFGVRRNAPPQVEAAVEPAFLAAIPPK